MNQISQEKFYLRKIINGVAHVAVDVTVVEEDLEEEEEATTKKEEDYLSTL